MAFTAAAAGIAWVLCLPLGPAASAFATASSVYAVQLSLQSSVIDGLKRAALMALSVLVAVTILRIIGLSVWAVVVLVLCSLATGRLLRLNASVTLQIPATAIFVLALGTSVSDSQVFVRVLATLVGAVVGAGASVAAHAGDPQIPARRSIVSILRSIAQLLGDMATGLASGLDRRDASEWLSRARQLGQNAAEQRRDIDRAVSFIQWDPLGHREDALDLSRLFAATEHSVFQVRDIARTLFEASLKTKSRPVTPGLVPLLQSTATAFQLQADRLEGQDLSLDAALQAVRASHRASLSNVRAADDTGVWLASGSVLSDIERMVQQLEGSTPALDVTGRQKHPRVLGRLRTRPKRRSAAS